MTDITKSPSSAMSAVLGIMLVIALVAIFLWFANGRKRAFPGGLGRNLEGQITLEK